MLPPHLDANAISSCIGCIPSSASTISISGLSAISDDSTATLVPGLSKKRPLPLDNHGADVDVDIDVDPRTIGLAYTGPPDLDISRPLTFPGELLPGGGIKTQDLNM